MSKQTSANTAVEKVLHKHVACLEKMLDADVITYSGRIVDGADHAFRDAIEAAKKKQAKIS